MNNLNYRNPCYNIPLPPPTYKPTPPYHPHPPTYGELVYHTNNWVYFWTIYGDFWVFVKDVFSNGIVCGCIPNFLDYQVIGTPLCMPFNWITAYTRG